MWLISEPVLCFHTHSRFVPSNSSREVESRGSKSDKPLPSDRLTSWFGFATSRLFVFIDILALFSDFSRYQIRFHAKAQRTPRTQSRTTPQPLLIRGGELGPGLE